MKLNVFEILAHWKIKKKSQKSVLLENRDFQEIRKSPSYWNLTVLLS